MVGMITVRAENEGAAGQSTQSLPNAAPLPSWQHLVGAPHSLRAQASSGLVPPGDESGHEDSWGIGWFDEAGQVSLLRQTGSAADSGFYVFAAEGASRSGAGSGPARVLLGHLRKASCGAVTSENAHPVRADYGKRQTLLVAHNGTLRAPLLSFLRDELAQTEREETRSDSDTVVLSGWFAAKVEAATGNGETVHAALTNALRELMRYAERVSDGDVSKAYSAINLLIAHPDGLFVLRQFSREPEYYTLFARPLVGEEGTGYLVASEKTDALPGWEPLAPGLLTGFTKTGETHTAWVQKP